MGKSYWTRPLTLTTHLCDHHQRKVIMRSVAGAVVYKEQGEGKRGQGAQRARIRSNNLGGNVVLQRYLVMLFATVAGRRWWRAREG